MTAVRIDSTIPTIDLYLRVEAAEPPEEVPGSDLTRFRSATFSRSRHLFTMIEARNTSNDPVTGRNASAPSSLAGRNAPSSSDFASPVLVYPEGDTMSTKPPEFDLDMLKAVAPLTSNRSLLPAVLTPLSNTQSEPLDSCSTFNALELQFSPWASVAPNV